MDRLIIIGAGGQGKVAADVAEKTGSYVEIAFLDDGSLSECLGHPVLGKVAEIPRAETVSDELRVKMQKIRL